MSGDNGYYEVIQTRIKEKTRGGVGGDWQRWLLWKGDIGAEEKEQALQIDVWGKAKGLGSAKVKR